MCLEVHTHARNQFKNHNLSMLLTKLPLMIYEKMRQKCHVILQVHVVN